MGPTLLGLDIGSSSVKASILDAESGKTIASSHSPATELEIIAPQPGWAEQNPDTWWEHCVRAVAMLKESAGAPAFQQVAAIGISYQMHGLVIVDSSLKPLRNAIIWCDSRAVQIGEGAFESIGPKNCLRSLLNSPGNFTASKLKWVQLNEPDIFARVHRMILPGDYVALRLTGELSTTVSGLSEAILWDYLSEKPANTVLEYYGIPQSMLAPVRPSFGAQGTLTREAGAALGIAAGTPVTYRAGDQPNNAFSLSVLNPGEIAATAGTSGVVYGVTDKPIYDPLSRVNTFVHVNHRASAPRYGMLLCVNGTGILNSWIRRSLSASSLSYEAMNALAQSAPAGSEGLVVLPYGNGSERTLTNRDIGASMCYLQFNKHTQAHIIRAAQEGIVFALNYGLNIMRQAGVTIQTVRAGHANMFLSPVFGEAFATVSGATVELYSTDGAAGAARGAGIGSGLYLSEPDAFRGLEKIRTIEPSGITKDSYDEAYQRWLEALVSRLGEE